MQALQTDRVARFTAAAALALLLGAMSAIAGTPPRTERGFPLLRVFRSEDFKAGTQNFSVTQDARGLLHFGNLGGLLTYDGAWWSLLELPGKPAVLSVAPGAKGMIGIGSINQLGYAAPGADGQLEFHSLLPLLPANQRQLLGDIRGVCADGNGFLFASERMLVAWDGARSARIAADYRQTPAPRRCFPSGGRIYIAGGDGLQQYGGGSSFAGRSVDAVTPHGIVSVRGEGLFTLDEKPYAPAFSEWLRDKNVSGMVELPHGELAVLTSEDGLAIVDASGKLVQRIDSNGGLPELALSDGTYDREGALWVTANGGMVRIDLAGPATELDARQGLRGAVNDVRRFDGVLYAGSSHGLFRFSSDAPLRATRVDGVPAAAWSLTRVGEELFVTTSKGIYRIRPGQPPAVIPGTEKMTVYSLLVPRTDPATLWLASRGGVGRLRLHDDGWRFDSLLPNGKPYARTLAEVGDSIYCGTIFNGVLRIHRDDSIELLGHGETGVTVAGGRLLAITPERKIFTLDEQGKLVPDPRFRDAKLPPDFFSVAADRERNLWLNSVPPTRLARRADGTYEHEARPVAAATVGDIQTVQVDEDDVVWFGSDRGLLRYERPSGSEAAPLPLPSPGIHRAVGGRDRVLYSRFMPTRREVEMPHGLGRLRIEFSPMTFRPPVAYEYRLQPVDADWSRWSEEPFIDYTNLAEGDYTFRIRVRNGGGIVSDEVRWSFRVLPPWYREPAAMLLWIALAIAILALIVRLRTGALQRQAEKLRSRVAEQTIELRETVTLLKEANARLEDLSTHDELTGVANRRSFVGTLAAEWELARDRRETVALIMFDLDHFKEMNDTHGHQAGDEVLRRVGGTLGECPRGIPARYGGEEFAVLLPNCGIVAAAQLAEELRASIERLGIGVTASFGIAAMVPAAGTPPQALIRRADDALYVAKRSGRNCVRVDDAAVA